MTNNRLDIRELPPAERHTKILEAFERLDAGDTLLFVNDHNPRPLIRQMEGNVESFDAEHYQIEQKGEQKFVIELPKRDLDTPDIEDQIRTTLADVDDPALGEISVLNSGLVTDIEARTVGVEEGDGQSEVTIALNMMGLGDAQRESLADEIVTTVQERTDVQRIQIVAGETSGGGTFKTSESSEKTNIQAISEMKARERLGDVQHPDRTMDVVEAETVTDIAINGLTVTVSVDTDDLSAWDRDRQAELFNRMGSALYNADGVRSVRIDTGDEIQSINRQTHEDPAMADVAGEGMGGPPGMDEGTTPLQQPGQVAGQNAEIPPTLEISGIDSIVVVASAKGGVGKTTIATQLARGFAADDDQGTVGLLDADFSGPDIPQIFDIDPRITEGQTINPVEHDGIQVMSLGLMKNHPRAWNGNMIHNALFNLLEDVDWDVETLLVDLPPGASDTMMTFLQFVPIDGVVLVTTPYPTAIADTNAGATLFREGDVPVVGAVVNMIGFECPNCGDSHTLFEDGDYESQLAFPILAEIPFGERFRRFDGELPEKISELTSTVVENIPENDRVAIPDTAVDVRGYPEHGRFEAVEDEFRVREPGETISVVSDRHPAGLAVSLAELTGREAGPSEVFDEYTVQTAAADTWVLTVQKPSDPIEGRTGG